MSWSSGAYRCAALHSYPQAVRHFDSRGPVKSKRWKIWERPLVGTRDTWLKLTKEETGEYYDLQVYDRVAIRYEKPKANGEYTVFLGSMGSHNHVAALLHRIGWNVWAKKLQVYGGGEVLVPISYTCKSLEGSLAEGWSARLIFNAAHRLLLDKSEHRLASIKCSTPENKEKRRYLREQLNVILDLVVLRVPQFHNDSSVSYGRGTAFGSMEGNYARDVGNMLNVVVQNREGLSESALQPLLQMAQEVYNMALSKKYIGDVRLGRGHFQATGYKYPQLTQECFRNSLMGALLRYTSAVRATGYKTLPMFPDELPRKYFFAGAR